MNKEHLHTDGRPYTKEEFVEKIKTDESFAKRFGNLGKIYGYQWRNWNGEIDQISELIKQIKENPDSRRLLVSAWNASDLPHQVLPPCHYGFQVYTRELSLEERVRCYETTLGRLHFIPPTIDTLDKENIPTRAISLMWNQRSVDTFLGLPFNIASYGLLLEIIAKQVNMIPDELIGNLGDVHLYSNHVEQAKEQIGRELSRDEKLVLIDQPDQKLVSYFNENPDKLEEFLDKPMLSRIPFELPTLKHLRSDDKYKLLCEFPLLWDKLKISDFEIENYQSHPTIKAKLSN